MRRSDTSRAAALSAALDLCDPPERRSRVWGVASKVVPPIKVIAEVTST
jgi:hypothetical protein